MGNRVADRKAFSNTQPLSPKRILNPLSCHFPLIPGDLSTVRNTNRLLAPFARQKDHVSRLRLAHRLKNSLFAVFDNKERLAVFFPCATRAFC